mmetsp:Transcript_4223/g.12148  ORF Transcript_4223/g.12148 Transcript_4223/m.12148 type:complete len:223 (+) Transcript_4223:622-1290(+)
MDEGSAIADEDVVLVDRIVEDSCLLQVQKASQHVDSDQQTELRGKQGVACNLVHRCALVGQELRQTHLACGHHDDGGLLPDLSLEDGNDLVGRRKLGSVKCVQAAAGAELAQSPRRVGVHPLHRHPEVLVLPRVRHVHLAVDAGPHAAHALGTQHLQPIRRHSEKVVPVVAALMQHKHVCQALVGSAPIPMLVVPFIVIIVVSPEASRRHIRHCQPRERRRR